jgi:hypothetical protein
MPSPGWAHGIREGWHLLRRAWGWLSSPWGIGIPAALLALGLLWMLLASQAPEPRDPAYGLWVARARLRFGALFDPLERLGLWALRETPGWRLAWAALGLSLLVHALEAAAARRRWAALSAAALLGAILVGIAGEALPPPLSVSLAPGEGRSVGAFWLTLEEGRIVLWEQGNPVGGLTFAPNRPLRLGPYIALAWREGAVLELRAAGPEGPLTLRAALDAPPVSSLLLHPSPEGEAFAALPQAGWILRLSLPRTLTVFREGTGEVVWQEALPALRDGETLERALPGGYALALTARPVYRIVLLSPLVFAQWVLSGAMALIGLLAGALQILPAAFARRSRSPGHAEPGPPTA